MNLKDAFSAQRSSTAQPGAVKDTFAALDALPADEVTKLTIRLPKSLHKDIKAQAVADDISVQALAIHALEHALSARKTESQ